MNFFDNQLNGLPMRTFLTVIFTILLVGCSDFDSLNQDPNNPAEPRTDLMLADAQRSVGAYIAAVQGALYVQYFSEVYYTDASQYGYTSFDFSSWYSNTDPDNPEIKSGALSNLQTIIDLNSNDETSGNSNVTVGGGTNNQIAVARILKAYFFHTITDRWGMVPYSEALQGVENQTPKYDGQASIYQDLLTELNEAVNQINDQEAPAGDFMLEGDMERWKNFANTLRMRIALRMADAEPSLAEQEFTDAYNVGHIQQDMFYTYVAGDANENPWYDRFETRIDYAISKPIADTMKAFNDLRLTRFAADSANTGPFAGSGFPDMDDIDGFPYGLSQDSAGEIGNTTRSLPASNILQESASLPVFTMAEVNFMLAEAVERDWISGSARNYYQAGIEASWRQWGVYNSADFSAYMNQSEIAYDSGQWKQKIGFQKWLALFPQGYESWAEWRRLGYPELEPAFQPLNNSGEIPLRQGYPVSERELNTENYQAARQAQGPDELDTHLWWDR